MASERDTRRDVYADLLRDTRGLRREQSGARDQWFAQLSNPQKEELLFELEMLLKGLACFGNARNHPGPPRETPAVAQDFRTDMRIVRDSLDRSIQLIRRLLGEKDRAFTFTRYLESVLPEDSERTQLIKDQLSQDTPEESLFLLRNSFASFVEMADGLLRIGRISHRQHHALLGTVTREVGRNVFFNPLVALEFRTEFDRIHNPQVLDALQSVESDAAHRALALTFLTLFRCIRYTALIDQYAADPASARRAYVILAVLRSDLRALTRFLTRRAPDVIADGFERELVSVQAADLHGRYDELARRAARLASLRATLENVANTLRVEVRRCFERDLTEPGDDVNDEGLGPQLVVASATLRASLQHGIRTLCSELRPDVAPPDLVSTEQGRKAASERLRRDVWMFNQILRGFLTKAKANQGDSDRWAGFESFQFVREFLDHFRTIGYQLARMSDYEHLDRFMTALESLRDADLLDEQRMQYAIQECEAFHAYLSDLFDKVSQRAELRDEPFDRKAAAETLRVYLGAA